LNLSVPFSGSLPMLLRECRIAEHCTECDFSTLQRVSPDATDINGIVGSRMATNFSTLQRVSPDATG